MLIVLKKQAIQCLSTANRISHNHSRVGYRRCWGSSTQRIERLDPAPTKSSANTEEGEPCTTWCSNTYVAAVRCACCCNLSVCVGRNIGPGFILIIKSLVKTSSLKKVAFNLTLLVTKQLPSDAAVVVVVVAVVAVVVVALVVAIDEEAETNPDVSFKTQISIYFHS